MNEDTFRKKYKVKGNVNTILNEMIKGLRQKRPKVPSELTYTIFEAGSFAQIWLQTKGCAYSKAGSCSCCDYWEGATIVNIADEFNKALEELSENIEILLIETSGSVLDESEITMEELKKILEYSKKRKFSKIIIETHINTLNEKKLDLIKDIMDDTTVCIEVGIESLDKQVLQYSLNKMSVVGLKKLKQYINLVHEKGFKFIANVMVGVPFLTLDNQIKDAVNSIHQLFDFGVDFVMLFPINIKEYTLVYWLYQNNLFDPVYGQTIVEVLNQVSKELLSRIDVVWYGNRKQENPAYQQELLGPYYCDECNDRMMNFFQSFNQLICNKDRVDLLEQCYQLPCQCKSEIRKKLSKECVEERDFYHMLDTYYEQIKKYSLMNIE
ncbi:hypothetical protein [Vallitalea sp.]|jgi:radical SAM enzyme (TIGR01210 family)|uniref:hypothetical protein n=1 Tax=Vallitalea sp. TaxID=1882829 RepID=UPI0025DCF8F6|nr:hypothetical protein [Vallitalea sp.]MCT4688869.1 hypothetical protein [Vallitalea sp.]